jgi:Lysine methyltransferase
MLEIRITTPTTTITSAEYGTLRLRQFGSQDTRWGIYSTVWDGGIALLQYVATHWDPVVRQIRQVEENRARRSVNGREIGSDVSVYVLDIGSGTGVTGLGIAALTKGSCRVAVTDLQEALPLLKENVELNMIHWTEDRFSHSPTIAELTWGHQPCAEWLTEFLRQTHDSDTCAGTDSTAYSSNQCRRRILITGADIIYRPSLFDPLLTTLVDLHEKLHDAAIVDIWFSCQSKRSYLNDFWEAARKRGFTSKLIAIVRMNNDKIIDLSQIVIEAATDSEFPPSTPKGHGINWIVELTRN